MTIKYCLPIIKNTEAEVLQALKIKGFDFYEVWLDYIKGLEEKLITKMAKKNTIFVLRRRSLEKQELALDLRKQIISLLSKVKTFLDLDFLTQHEELIFLKENNHRVKLILSFHNYKETPNLDFLKTVINKMKQYKPDIYKVSTFCQKEKDTLTLLQLLLWLKEQKLKFIVLGMGKLGLPVRILGTLWGNQINFTPLTTKEESAPGQLTKRGLELILKELNYGRQ